MDNKTKATATLDDMVFENRNKAYGAYDLRKAYPKAITKSTLIGSAIFVAALVAPMLYASIKPKAKQEVAVEIDLTKLKEEKQEDDKPKELPPPPPPEEKPPEVATIKFLPPEPKPDEEVKQEDPPPKQEEVEKAVISNTTKEGVEATEVAAPPPVVEVAAAKPAEIEKPDEIFTTVEQNPEFPGGIKEMYGFLGKNIKYPSAAQRANVAGKVFVKFVVEKNGEIGDVQVLKGIGFGCDEEAIRVIKSMPRWSPGKQNGRAVRVYYTMPVVYQLE